MDDKKGIYRQAALERLSTPEQLDRVLRAVPSLAWLAVLGFYGALAVALAIAVFTQVPVKVNGEGMFILPGGIQEVVAENGGRVLALPVTRGGAVAVGDLVAEIERPELRQDIQVAKAELEDAQGQFRLVEENNRLQIDERATVAQARRVALEQTVSYLEERIGYLRERETYERELIKKSVITRKRGIDTRIELNDVKMKLAEAANDRRRIDLEEKTFQMERQRELIEKEIKVNEARRHLETLTARIARESKVLSPYAGVVAELKINPGEVIEPGTALLSLVPAPDAAAGAADDGGLVTILFVPPEHGKKLREGMRVEIAPSTVKREEHGFVLGTVRSVATIPSTREGMLRVLKNERLVERLAGTGAPFEVVVDLERNPNNPSGLAWSSSRGPEAAIGPGTLCKAEVTVRRVHLVALAIPGLEQVLAGWGL